MANARSALRYALAYAERGWHVFPVWGAKGGKCGCGVETCKQPGKHPVSPLVRSGMSDATTDPDTIRRWWGARPDAGVAISLAPSGLVAVDVDPRNGGYLTLELLEEQHGKIDTDLVQLTQGGGEHRFFYLEAGSALQLPGKLGDGVDLKRNGYSVLPPTTGPAGVYDWEVSSNPLDGALPAPLPDWIRSLGAPVDRPEFASSAAARYVTEEQLADLRDAMTHIPAEDRDTWVDIGMALRLLGQAGWDLWDTWSATSDKYDPVDQIRTWRSFKPKRINYESVFAKAAQRGWVNPMSKPPAPAPSPEDEARYDRDLALANGTARVVQCPERQAVPIPVRSLEDLARWLCEATGAEYGVATQMAALAVAALAASRRYETPQGDGVHLHQVLSAQSFAEAAPLIDAVAGLIRAAGLRRMLSEQRMTSGHAMIARLYRSPAMLYTPMDFGRRFFGPRYANIEELNADIGRNFARDQVPIDSPHEYGLRKSELNDGDQAVIYRPAFNLFAFTAEVDLPNLFADNYMGRGLIETLIFGRVSVDYPREQHIDVTPPTDAMARIRALRGLPEQDGDVDAATLFGDISELVPQGVRIVDFSAAPASARYAELTALSDDTRHRPLLQGSRALLRRVAAVLAAFEQPERPVVTPTMLSWAADLVSWSTREILQASQSGAGDDGKSAAYERVLAAITKAGRDGIKPGYLPRSCKPYRSMSSEQRAALIKQLQDDDEITQLPDTGALVARSAVEFQGKSGREGAAQ